MEVGYTYLHSRPYLNTADVFTTLRDCFAGNRRIKEQSQRYLPRPGGFPDKADGDAMYAAYLGRALFYNVIEPTVRGLVGMVFEVPPVVALPKGLEPLADAITPDGNSLVESVSFALQETLHMGRHGLLLDLPREEATDWTPYVTHYLAEDITCWQTRMLRGRKQLTQVILRDAPQAGDKDTDRRYRELYLDLSGVTPAYRVRCYLCTGTDKGAQVTLVEEVTPQIRGQALGYIPFYFIGPYSNRPEIEKSPMLDMCDAAIKHYQVGADYFHALYMLAQPTPYIIGGDPNDDSWVPKAIGAGAFWLLPPGVTRVDMLEYSGSGVGSLLEARGSLEDQMASLGARLAQRQNVPETAEAVKIRLRHQVSVVESSVRSVADAYRVLLRDAADWVGADRKSVDFAMDHDFIFSRLDPGMLSALISACFEKRAISRSVFHANLQRGQIIPPTRTVAEEVAEIGQATQAAPDPNTNQPPGASAPPNSG